MILQELDQNLVGDEGAKVLGLMLKLTSKIVRLNLSSNQLGKRGAQAIAEALKLNNSLVDLDLSSSEGPYNNCIGEEGVKYLA